MESNAAIYCLISVLFAYALVANAAVKRTQSNKLTVTMPSECLENELCTVKPVDWPTERMDRIARQLRKRIYRHAPSSSVSTLRPKTNDNCVEKIKKVKPYIVVTRNNTQISLSINQTIDIVTCSTEKAPCLFSVAPNDPQKPRFCCETQHNLVRLKTWNIELNKTEIHQVQVPTGCSCMKTDNISVEATSNLRKFLSSGGLRT